MDVEGEQRASVKFCLTALQSFECCTKRPGPARAEHLLLPRRFFSLYIIKGKHSNVRFYSESVLSTQKICGETVPWLNENRGSDVVVSTSILLALATIVVIMRVFARRIAKLKFGYDDWLVGLALVGHPFHTPAV